MHNHAICPALGLSPLCPSGGYKPGNLLSCFFTATLLLLTGTLAAQTTWDGSSSSDWNTAANWSAGVPGVGDDVTIPNVANDPVIPVGPGAVAKSVTINSGAALTINASASLTLNGATAGTKSLTNNGTVINNGTLSVGTTSSSGEYGIWNYTSFTNNGTINLDRVGLMALVNDGTFTNSGTMLIGAQGVGFQTAIFTNLTFTNNACGFIRVFTNSYITTNNGTFNNAGILIDNCTFASDITTNTGILQNLNGGVFVIVNNTGVRLDGAGKVWSGCSSTNWNVANNWHDRTVPTATDNVYIYDMPNDPVISTGTSAVANWVKVASGGALTINAGGSLSLDNTPNGESLNNDGTIGNAGLIQIGASVNGGGTGFGNQGLLNNNSGGEIKIDRTGVFGLVNNGTVNNAGKITLGTIASVGQTGVANSGTFNNNAGGEIKGDNCTHTILWNHNNGIFNNNTKITIGSVANAGDYGIRNWNVFNNNATGEISIDRVTVHGIYNINSFSDFAEFYNAGKITIGAAVAPNTNGLYNDNIFANQACGEIFMYAPLNNSDIFTNAGLFRVSTASAHTNTGLTNNGIITYAQSNFIPNVTNNDVVVKPFTTTCSASPALEIGGSNSFTIATTWHSDLNLTTAAGTFNLATNRFTWNSTPAAGTYTVYFSINDAGNGCARTVSVPVTVNPPTMANAGGDQTTCTATGSATMAGNAPTTGTGTWSQVSGPVSATITTPGSPGTTITGMTTAGTYIFKWTIANPPCTASEDQMSMVANAPPTAANAGPDASPCGLTSALAGNTPGTGTGTWTKESGPGTANFVNANSPTTNVTVSVAGAYAFRWTIANAPCAASTNDVVITFTPGPTTANAGGDQTTCTATGSATMTGNAPTTGTGTWSQVSGPVSATIT
ncbi:MAG: hypothetical protein ABMA02_10835, partial [Saprospiraceae bacterium]